MSGPAQVRSTPAIEALQQALARFEKRVQAALDTLDGEMHRTEDWLEHDRPSHWKRQLHEAEDQLHAAKMDLERCLMMTVAGQRPTCREQQAAVRVAQERLAYCQQKREVIRTWQRDFRHESLEFRGRIGQLRRALEHDIPRARAALTKTLRRLEEYQLERPPEATTLVEEHAVSNEPVNATNAAGGSPIPKPSEAGNAPLEDSGTDSPSSHDLSTPNSPAAR